jgi:hypothetical protein
MTPTHTTSVSRILQLGHWIYVANEMIKSYEMDAAKYSDPDMKLNALRRVLSLESIHRKIRRYTRIKARLIRWGREMVARVSPQELETLREINKLQNSQLRQAA